MPKKYTKEDFAKIFQAKFPNYELLSDYKGSKKEIIVRCKLDGYEWITTPKRLMAGNGCQKCYNKRRGDSTRKEKDEFIKQAKKRHPGKYDYSKVEYKNNKTPVTLICPKHGEFKIRPDKHISRGDGCRKCAIEQNGLNKRLSLEEFVARARKIHGNRYDYSKVDYKTTEEPICIICPIHGEFWQPPETHLSGCGCPFCRQSHMENSVMRFLEENNIPFEYQKRFKWLGRKSIDFFLPKYNIALECQGLQHFRPVYGRKRTEEEKTKEFLKIFNRDLLKKKECDENGIKIYYMIYSKNQKIDGDLAEIYNSNNMFYSTDEIINFIPQISIFEEIVKETLDNML